MPAFGLTRVALVCLVVATLASCGGNAIPLSVNDPSAAAEATIPGQSATAVDKTGSRIGPNDQLAVVREAFYALRQAWLNENMPIEGPHDGLTLQNCTVGDWNYLASDINALNWAIAKVGGGNWNSGRPNASVTNTSVDMSSFGYEAYGCYERAGQCLFFVNLILKRSRNYETLPTWAGFAAISNPLPANSNTQLGDVIYHLGSPNHIAIVVKKLANGLDVVDSNYVGCGSYAIQPQRNNGYWPINYYSEIVGRHAYTYSQLASWHRYSGSGRWY